MIYKELKMNEEHNIHYCEFGDLSSAKKIIIAIHGFCGTKTSKTIRKLAEKVNAVNIAIVSFDLPGHGDSETNGDRLRVDICLEYIKTMYNFIHSTYPTIPISFFATSFGGYLTLLFSAKYPELKISEIGLRCPAVKMFECMHTLNKDIDMCSPSSYPIEMGYERKIKIYKDFVDDLFNNDVTAIDKFSHNITILHGYDDEVAPYFYSVNLSEKHNNINLFLLHDCKHKVKTDDNGVQMNTIMTFFSDLYQ